MIGAESRAEVFARSVRIKATHLGYKKTVKNVAKVNAQNHRFYCEEFKAKVTVEEYFQRSRFPLEMIMGWYSCSIGQNTIYDFGFHDCHSLMLVGRSRICFQRNSAMFYRTSRSETSSQTNIRPKYVLNS
jgi:hypothetical protein